MPNIQKEPKQKMMALLDKAEEQSRTFKSIAAEMYKFAPQKLNESQKRRSRTLPKRLPT